MVNNSELIRPMLSFVDKDDFYFVQIFKRRKDNPYLGKDQIELGNFYIDSWDDFDFKLPHIINICDVENARAYIRVNKRNYNALAKHMLKRVVDIVFTENCRALRNSFDSVAGEFHSDPDKKWIVDIDWKDFENVGQTVSDIIGGNQHNITLIKNSNDEWEFIHGESRIAELLSLVQQLQYEAEREPMMKIIPTKNGAHIITRPFSLMTFKIKFPKIDVHHDNPTILYCP